MLTMANMDISPVPDLRIMAMAVKAADKDMEEMEGKTMGSRGFSLSGGPSAGPSCA